MGWFISINFYLVVETKKGLLGLSSRVRTITIDEEAAGGRPRAPVPFVLRCHIARVNIAKGASMSIRHDTAGWVHSSH